MTAVHRGERSPVPPAALSGSEQGEQLWRVPGAPFATTVVMADLLPGTQAYAETYRDSPPVLVIDTGPTEIQLSMPGDRVTLTDLAAVDLILEALAAYRTALLPHLDFTGAP